MLLPQLLAYREEQDNELKKRLERSVQTISEREFLKLLDLLSSGRKRELLASLIAVKKKKNPNLQCWLLYMDMGCILLLSIRAHPNPSLCTLRCRVPCHLLSRHGCVSHFSFTLGKNELQAVVDESWNV